MERGKRDWQLESLEWLQYMAQLPSRPIPFSGLTGSLPLATGRFIYMGASALNGDSSSHFFVVRDGTDATGEIICGVGAAIDSYVTDRPGGTGVLVDKGIFLSLTGGPWSGSIYAIPLWEYEFTMPGH